MPPPPPPPPTSSPPRHEAEERHDADAQSRGSAAAAAGKKGKALSLREQARQARRSRAHSNASAGPAAGAAAGGSEGGSGADARSLAGGSSGELLRSESGASDTVSLVLSDANRSISSGAQELPPSEQQGDDDAQPKRSSAPSFKVNIPTMRSFKIPFTQIEIVSERSAVT
mmetsp:Transcript_36985/g.90195  ORF Transcript_36985/g.90195 Transcript_36985/m.90195 type:complete len:171 (+) Transcript_36985:2316-2828(+)